MEWSYLRNFDESCASPWWWTMHVTLRLEQSYDALHPSVFMLFFWCHTVQKHQLSRIQHVIEKGRERPCFPRWLYPLQLKETHANRKYVSKSWEDIFRNLGDWWQPQLGNVSYLSRFFNRADEQLTLMISGVTYAATCNTFLLLRGLSLLSSALVVVLLNCYTCFLHLLDLLTVSQSLWATILFSHLTFFTIELMIL